MASRLEAGLAKERDLRTLLASIRVMLESLIDGVVDDHETVNKVFAKYPY